MCTYVWVQCECVDGCPWRLEEGVGSLRAGAIGVCELAALCGAGNQRRASGRAASSPSHGALPFTMPVPGNSPGSQASKLRPSLYPLSTYI